MARNLMGLYRDLAVAEQLVRDLVGSGVPHDHISVICHKSSRSDRGRSIEGLTPLPDDGNLMARGPLRDVLTRGSSGFSPGARSNDVTTALTTSGVPADEASLYHQGISRGGALVAVQVRGHDPTRIADVMERYDPVDLGTTSRKGQASKDLEPHRKFGDSKLREDRTIPVVEEDVEIGKRGVARGGVRVHSRPVTERVEKDVTLRDEKVDVERRQVNRPLDGEDRDRAFREETVEMIERGEEPVVHKDARVVEEVHVGKTATERTEHISETARHTEVEIEKLTPEEFGRFEPRFRQHFGERFQSGERFDAYRPAYEMGAIMARDGKTEGRTRDWREIEPLARTRWEKSRYGQTMPYDRARDCIAFGYDEARSTRV